MSKTKQHDKVKVINVISHPSKGRVKEVDYVLTLCYNAKGHKTGMWWVNKQNPDDRFHKTKGDSHVIIQQQGK